MIEIDKLLTINELSDINVLISNARWQSGAHSAGENAEKQKHNQEMDQSCESWEKINSLAVSRLFNHPEFQRTALPNKVSAAFISRYTSGMHYGQHVDNPVMGTPGALYRSDIACTVFLSDPADYEGGELNIHTRFGPVKVKLDAGCAVVYPASSIHEVLPVTSGERVVCVLWAQSLVADAHKREILAELDDARAALQLKLPEAKVTHSIDHTYMNLIRLWTTL